MTIDLHLGDCLDVMPTIADQSIDAIITDPPYPEIDRPYGRMTEAAWHAMMHRLIPECRRVLKPKGSAVFILQPNSRKVGSMRPWLFEFQAWACREWNIVQDAYWWNYTAITEAHAIQGRLMRPSVKACVWLGPPDCYRDQDAILWDEADSTRAWRQGTRLSGKNFKKPSGHHAERDAIIRSIEKKGGKVLPFNLIPVMGSDRWKSGGALGHPAATPLPLADWWVRYISPVDGVVLDPFSGSGTVPLAALKRGRSAIGIEKMPEYHAMAESRIAAARLPLLEPA